MQLTYLRTAMYMATLLLAPLTMEANVITQAIVGGGNTTYGYSYNGPLPGLSSNVGAGVYPGCDTAHGDVCSGSGTTGSSGLANSSTDSSSLTQPAGDSASASASADLPSGILGASGAGSAYIDGGGYESCCTGQALAQFGDTLHFSVAGATPATVTDIGVSFTVNGDFGINPGLTGGIWEAQVDNTLLFGNARFREQDTVTPYVAPNVSYLGVNGWVSYTENETSPGNYVFTGIYALTGSSGDLGFDDALSIFASGAHSDFGGAVSFQLPSGVTFTTGDGFLSNPPSSPSSAVPEPDTWMLLGSGLAFVAAGARRRRLSDGRR